MDNSVEISAAEDAFLRAVRSGRAGSEVGDDLCPPWWPRRPRSPRGPLRAGDVHGDVRAADRIYAGLTLLATTFQFSDETMAKEVRTVALAHVRDGAQVLAHGAARAWEPGDDICPPWPWGWHGAPPPRGLAGSWPWPEPVASTSMPGRAADLLDALGLLQAYNLAAKIGDASARGAATTAIGTALAEHAATVVRAFG